jgi:hypothetical protein
MTTHDADKPIYPRGTVTLKTNPFNQLGYLHPYVATGLAQAVEHPATDGGNLQAINEAFAYQLEVPDLIGKNQCTRTLAVYGLGTDPRSGEKGWFGILTDTPSLVDAVLAADKQQGPYKSWMLPREHTSIKQIIDEVDNTRRIIRLRPSVWQRRYHQVEEMRLDAKLTYAAIMGDINPGQAQIDIYLPSIDGLQEIGINENTVKITSVSLTTTEGNKHLIDAVKPIGYRTSGIGRAVIGAVPAYGTKLPENVQATLHFVGRGKRTA